MTKMPLDTLSVSLKSTEVHLHSHHSDLFVSGGSLRGKIDNSEAPKTVRGGGLCSRAVHIRVTLLLLLRRSCAHTWHVLAFVVTCHRLKWTIFIIGFP